MSTTRSKPGVRPPPPAPPQHESGRPNSCGAPPLPAPRSYLVSSHTKKFGGGTDTGSPTAGNNVSGGNISGTLGAIPSKPLGPPPPLPSTPRPTSNPQMQHHFLNEGVTTPRSAPTSRPPVLFSPGSPISPLSPVSSQGTIDPAASSDDAQGFGSCLQNSIEMITKKHEDELLVLESLRSHVFHRSRMDKEYSENLAKANLKAKRKMGNANNKSAIVQVIVLLGIST